MMRDIINSKSRTFLLFCFCFILGVGIFSWRLVDSQFGFYLYVSLFIILFNVVIFWFNVNLRFGLVCLLFFVLGGLRFYLSVPSYSVKNINYYNGRIVNFIATVGSLTESGGANSIVTVNVRSLDNSKIRGKVLLYLPLYTDLKYGDILKINCQLQTPKNSSNFLSYDKYLARNGVWSICSWPKVEKLNLKQNLASEVINVFFNLRVYIQNKVNNLWPEPESILMSGLLYGGSKNFSTEVKKDFSVAGVTHIVAISGYNISIIVVVLMNFLLGVGFNRRSAFYFVVGGLILFVLFTGASASVVRAGVMGVIVLLSTQWGRLSQIGNVLVFTAAVMLLCNPFVLIWDMGFQLSFLSTLGLVYISPILKKFWPDKEKQVVVNIFKENFICTISAIVATLPLILFQFGRLSLVAPLANVLILWIVPYLMLFGFIAVILAFIFYPLAQVVAWLSYFGLKYVIIIAHNLAHWPMASINFTIPLWAMCAIYILIIYYTSKRVD